MATGFPGSLHDARMLRLTDVYWAAEDETILMEPIFDFSGTVMRPLSWETLLIRTKPGLSDHLRILVGLCATRRRSTKR